MRALALLVIVAVLALLKPVTLAQSTQWWLINVYQPSLQPACSGDLSLGLADQRPSGNCGSPIACNVAGGFSNSQGCVGTSTPSTASFGSRVVVQTRYPGTGVCTGAPSTLTAVTSSGSCITYSGTSCTCQRARDALCMSGCAADKCPFLHLHLSLRSSDMRAVSGHVDAGLQNFQRPLVREHTFFCASRESFTHADSSQLRHQRVLLVQHDCGHHRTAGAVLCVWRRRLQLRMRGQRRARHAGGAVARARCLDDVLTKHL